MAETLVDAVEAQHRALESVVLELNKAIAKRDPEAAAERLSAVRKLLEGHFELENKQLYPRFLELAAGRETTLHPLFRRLLPKA